MDTIFQVLLIWFVVSIFASLVIGRVLGVMNQRQIMRKSLTTPSHAESYKGAYQTMSFARNAPTMRNSE